MTTLIHLLIHFFFYLIWNTFKLW